MAHKIVIMYGSDEVSNGGGRQAQHRQALEQAAEQLASVGSRFFRMVKAQMVRTLDIPEDIRELGESQMMVLHALGKGPHLTSELARLHNVSNPTITRVVDALVEKGLVQRRPDAEDRRCIFLQLTEEGNAKRETIHGLFHDAMLRVLAPLNEEQLQDIIRAYTHLSTLLPEGAANTTEGIKGTHAGHKEAVEA